MTPQPATFSRFSFFAMLGRAPCRGWILFLILWASTRVRICLASAAEIQSAKVAFLPARICRENAAPRIEFKHLRSNCRVPGGFGLVARCRSALPPMLSSVRFVHQQLSHAAREHGLQNGKAFSSRFVVDVSSSLPVHTWMPRLVGATRPCSRHVVLEPSARRVVKAHMTVVSLVECTSAEQEQCDSASD